MDHFRQSWKEIKDTSKISSVDEKLIRDMDKVLATEIPMLMKEAGLPLTKIGSTTSLWVGLRAWLRRLFE